MVMIQFNEFKNNSKHMGRLYIMMETGHIHQWKRQDHSVHVIEINGYPYEEKNSV